MAEGDAPRGTMRLTFTRRGGKNDELLIERADRSPERIDCPKQGIIPHDMVHFAVESVVDHPGFLALVANGGAAVFATGGGESEEAIERLVETCQAEMWGGRVPAADFIATYEHACEARGHPAAPVSAAQVDNIRALLDRLTEQWAAVPLNGSLTVEL